MIKKNFVFFILICITKLYSQKESDNWYFGDKAALKFDNDNKVTVLEDSKSNAFYGCSTISDKKGNLLFYTNGSFVYNKQHTKMENGELLASDKEVLQTSVIIPKPKNPNLYYLITLKNSNDPPRFGPLIPAGLYYSIVDISKNNGNGMITKKNVLITSLVSEKLTAVHAKDGESIWLITFGKNNATNEFYDTFYSYKLNENGLNTTPVLSQLSNSSPINKGAIKASPNGKFIALSNTNNSFLADFNNETGKVENDKFLRITHGEGMQSISSRPKSYGIEFSQDSKYLYLETIDKGENIIFQFNTEDISVRQEIHISNKPKNYMQLAKDGNIYVTTAENEEIGGNFLSVIRPPKVKDIVTAAYEGNYIDLNLGETRLGLPNFIQSYFRTRIITESGCLNDPLTLEFDTYADVTSASWSFGDGNTSNEINPIHKYVNAGIYKVSCILTLNNREIYISKQIEIYNPDNYTITNKNMIQCDVNNNGINFFNLTDIKYNIIDYDLIDSMKFYLSHSYAVDNLNEIIDPENYESSSRKEIFFRIYNKKGCYTINSFFIETSFVELGNVLDYYTCSLSENSTNNNLGFFNLGEKRALIRNNLDLDKNVRLRFYSNAKNAQTNIGELDNNYTSKSTEIWLRADTSLGCGGIKPFQLIVNTAPIIKNIKDSYTICHDLSSNPPIIISADASNNRYEWRDQSNKIVSINQDFTLTKIGEYSLTVYKTENGIECSSFKSFEIINPEEPEVLSVKTDTSDETNNLINVSVKGNSKYEFSLDNINFEGNSTSFTFSNVTNGLKTIYIKDINNCEKTIEFKVSILGYPKFFSPNGDGLKDFWNIKGLDDSLYKSINIIIFNRFGKIVSKIKKINSDGWDGTYNGKQLQSNNYWFIAEIVDNNNDILKKSGYFSLIRN